MARKSDLSGKGTKTGHKIQHRRGSSGSGGMWNYKAPKTKRTFKLNIRKTKVDVDGEKMTIKVTMKEYKKLKDRDFKISKSELK